MLTGLFEGRAGWLAIVLACAGTLLAAWYASRLARRVVRRALIASLGEEVDSSSPMVRQPLRLVGAAVFLLVTAVLIFPALELAGLKPTTGVAAGQILAWLFGPGLRVGVISLLAYALVRSVTLLVKRFEYQLTTGTSLDALERGKRARTLGGLITRVTTIAVVGIAVLMILREFRIDIAPVLAAAGVTGLAIGFGAQTLVRDVISGFFLILEDQIRVGDVAAINGTEGLVEQINLRTIVLRDQEGTVHVFPNGSITTLANRSKDFAYYVIDVAIAYREDPDRVAAVLKDVGAELQQDPALGPFVLEPLEILGIDAFGEWAIHMKVRIKTVPLKQWDVGRELRKRIRKAFDVHGIEVPFPGRVVPQ
jgi:small-conductance mechanosensitive channel